MTQEQADQLEYIHSKIGTVIAGGIENASIKLTLSGTASNSTHASTGYISGSVTVNIKDGKVSLSNNGLVVYTNVHVGNGVIETRSAAVTVQYTEL